MNLDPALIAAAIPLQATAAGAIVDRSVGRSQVVIAAALAGIAALALGILVDAQAAFAVAASAASCAALLRSARFEVTLAAFAGIVIAAWTDPLLGMAGLCGMAWCLPADRRASMAWVGAAIAATLVPFPTETPPPALRALLFLVAAAVALAGRRAVPTAVIGPGMRRLIAIAAAALPGLALVALAFLYERRLMLPRDAVWPALAIAAGAAGAATAAGIAMLGLAAIASTRNDVKVPAAGALVAALLCFLILGPRAAWIIAPMLAIGAAVGLAILWRLPERRGLSRGPISHTPKGPLSGRSELNIPPPTKQRDE